MNGTISAVDICGPSRDLIFNGHVVEIDFSHAPTTNLDKFRTDADARVHTVCPRGVVSTGSISRVLRSVVSPDHRSACTRGQ